MKRLAGYTIAFISYLWMLGSLALYIRGAVQHYHASGTPPPGCISFSQHPCLTAVDVNASASALVDHFVYSTPAECQDACPEPPCRMTCERKGIRDMNECSTYAGGGLT